MMRRLLIKFDSAMYVHGNSSASGRDDLMVGTVDGLNSASYLKFDDLVSRLRFHTIFGAALGRELHLGLVQPARGHRAPGHRRVER